MVMNTETQKANAVKWIEALLSGKYKQGIGLLGNREIGFCCWGLGCYIVGMDYNPFYDWDSKLYKKIGFVNEGGYINPIFYNSISLADVNDDTNAGFKRIGKYLIKHAKTNFIPEVAEHITNHFKN